MKFYLIFNHSGQNKTLLTGSYFGIIKIQRMMVIFMADVFNTVSGNKMFELRQAVKELRERLKTEEDPDIVAEIKKEIMEKETNYNILAERLKVQNRGI